MKIASRTSLLPQITWAVLLGTGFATVWFLLVIWLASSAGEIWRAGKPKWPSRDELDFKADGTPLIVSTEWMENNQIKTFYRDLNGLTVPTPTREELLPGVTVVGEPEAPSLFAPTPTWHQRLTPLFNERARDINWYFVHTGNGDSSGYFVGYQRVSNRRVGFIGLNGARPDPVPASEQIPVRDALGRPNWSSAPFTIYWTGHDREIKVGPLDLPPRLVYLHSGNRLRQVDLDTGTVTTVLELSEPIESAGIPALEFWSGGHPVKPQPILVRTKNQLYALDHQHRITRQITIPPEISRRSLMIWFELADGQAIAEFLVPADGLGNASTEGLSNRLVYRIAADGTIQKPFEVSLRSGSFKADEASTRMQVFFGLPSPAFLVVIEPLILIMSDPANRQMASVMALMARLAPALLAVFALASILAVITWRRSCAFGLPKRQQVTWAAFVLALGLPAFVGFILCRRWPVRIPCPNCQVKAPRDRPACAACGTTFPDPPLKGIEIFA